MSRLSPTWKRLFLGVAFGALMMGVSGCAHSGSVSGTVKYQGKLLTSGTVVFVDEENHAAPPAYIQTDGTYAVPHIAVGTARIVIETSRPLPPEAQDHNSPEYKDYQTKVNTYVEIPEKYKDLEKSGKKFDVKSGPNVCNIELD